MQYNPHPSFQQTVHWKQTRLQKELPADYKTEIIDRKGRCGFIYVSIHRITDTFSNRPHILSLTFHYKNILIFLEKFLSFALAVKELIIKEMKGKEFQTCHFLEKIKCDRPILTGHHHIFAFNPHESRTIPSSTEHLCLEKIRKRLCPAAFFFGQKIDLQIEKEKKWKLWQKGGTFWRTYNTRKSEFNQNR